jgi:haloacetate dehalogenase
MMDDFETAEIQTGETSIFACWAGSGSPLLLLHGFPQTHLMWRSVAPMLARNFTVVCPDLRGLRAQRVPSFHPGPYPICEARHGTRHGDCHGAAGLCALLCRGA